MSPGLSLIKKEGGFKSFRQSRSAFSPLLKIRWVVTNANEPRFGFIVPKKIMPKVVDRNLSKRRIKGVLLKFRGKIMPADFLIFPKGELSALIF